MLIHGNWKKEMGSKLKEDPTSYGGAVHLPILISFGSYLSYACMHEHNNDSLFQSQGKWSFSDEALLRSVVFLDRIVRSHVCIDVRKGNIKSPIICMYSCTASWLYGDEHIKKLLGWGCTVVPNFCIGSLAIISTCTKLLYVAPSM